nr:MAG TPA: hypothetical protein [Caudoviricetes sp.]
MTPLFLSKSVVQWYKQKCAKGRPGNTWLALVFEWIASRGGIVRCDLRSGRGGAVQRKQET